MISVETIIPVKLPTKWRLLPERTSWQGRPIPIWPPNGRAYLKEDGDSFTQLVISIDNDNMLTISISNSKKELSRQESADIIRELLPSYYLDFVPHEVVNEGLLSEGINKRVVIGDELAPIQYFERQL